MFPRSTIRTVLSSAVLATSMLIAGCQRADPDASPREATTPADSVPATSERLLAQPPEGWERGVASITAGLRLTEYRPPQPLKDGWDDRLRFESSRDNPPRDPIQTVLALAEDQRHNCEGFEDHNTFSGFENGYPTSVHLLLCREDKRTKKAHVTMAKAIQGNDDLYLIVRSRSAPPPPSGLDLVSREDIAGWSLQLRALTLCDTQRADHPCPSVE